MYQVLLLFDPHNYFIPFLQAKLMLEVMLKITQLVSGRTEF